MKKDGMNAFATTVEHVAANLNAALGVERPPLKILGACSPMVAYEALLLDPWVVLPRQQGLVDGLAGVQS
jgi:uncharacterized protein (DUF302 family)